MHHDKKGEAIIDWVSQGVPEKFTEAFRKEYLGTSWCIATLPTGYPTTNNHQEGINSAVKRIWTRHERRHLIPFLKCVKRMLHDWSKRPHHACGWVVPQRSAAETHVLGENRTHVVCGWLLVRKGALAVCPVSPKFQIPCSDFAPREIFSRFLLLISSAVHCAAHVPVLQCLPAIVINS